MDLFNSKPVSEINILPYDGEVYYFETILTGKVADIYLSRLLETVEWKHDEAIIFGKLITTKRKVAWYGDKPFKYTYSKITKNALIWTKELLELKEIVENLTKETYNSCLLNLYHNGEEGMAWHSDGEKDLKKNGVIASLTLGATRKFSFKHKISKQKIDTILEHGSLLIMQGETQTHWQHRLPPTKKVQQPRINLTFRTIVK
ncbi:MAG: alpha-ketoglutarate-dependent dioxygenase AlkB family protein [Flavobacteriales bacterium]